MLLKIFKGEKIYIYITWTRDQRGCKLANRERGSFTFSKFVRNDTYLTTNPPFRADPAEMYTIFHIEKYAFFFLFSSMIIGEEASASRKFLFFLNHSPQKEAQLDTRQRKNIHSLN